MRPIRLCLAAGLTGAALAATPSLALGAPPANDNYLASTALNVAGGKMPLTFTDSVDTSEATTQPDLFNPSRTGLPLGGGKPENTACGVTSYGKTVWYDFHPNTDGGVEIKTSAGFDSVVTVYEWSDETAQITKTVKCQDTAGSLEDMLLFNLKGGHAYTVQVGGVAGPGGVVGGGPLTFNLDWFADSDDDGAPDEVDDCPSDPGKRTDGCPPTLNSSVRINLGGGAITNLAVDNVPKGAKIVARCSRCHASQTVKAKHFGSVRLSKFVGRPAPVGASVEVRVTMARTGKGTYEFGATGKYIKWPITSSGLGTAVKRCLHVKTGKIESCK
jgi:hypothetical protein